MRPSRALTILAAVALVTSLVPGATAQLTNEYQDENARHEPGGPVDTGNHDGFPGNGFATATEGSWDLVLHSYIENGHYLLGDTILEFNRILNEVAAAVTGSGTGQQYILPGLSDQDAFWGWFNDKGSGGYHNEDPVVSTSQSADGVIDDGADNHDEDVHFDDATSQCPADDPTCWTATGTWDEFIWRGPNSAVENGNHSYAKGEPGASDIHATDNDELYAFVSPGTHSSWFETAWGNEGDRVPEPAPGYGVISQGRDNAQHPEWQLQWFGQDWSGEVFASTDASLAMTTEIIVAANPADAGQEALFLVDQSDAADRDVYSAISPVVEDAYRMTVWDPADNGERDDIECDGGSCQEGNLLSAAPGITDEGPKERVKTFYSQDYADLREDIDQILADLTEPTEPVEGLAEDYSNGAPYKHEPNHPDDSYPGAVYNDGASYESLGDPYYDPTQDWSGYAASEQLFADWENRWNTYGVVVQGAFSYNWGVNAEEIGNPGAQDTQGPYMMSHFGWVGTWWDEENTDTWVGDLTQQGRCATADDPYCGGSSQNPQDYNHNPEGAPPDAETPEWRGTCNADVNFTVQPLGTPTRINPDTGEEEHAWGTTVPPVGVYQYPVFSEGVLIGEVEEGNATARYHQWGEIEVPVGCDEDDAAQGQWFPGDSILLPTGTATYPIKTKAEVTLTGSSDSRVDRSGTLGSLVDDPNQVVTDVDIINAWQSTTHDYETPDTNEYS